jgi:hypothetical protein
MWEQWEKMAVMNMQVSNNTGEYGWLRNCCMELAG